MRAEPEACLPAPRGPLSDGGGGGLAAELPDVEPVARGRDEHARRDDGGRVECCADVVLGNLAFGEEVVAVVVVNRDKVAALVAEVHGAVAAHRRAGEGGLGLARIRPCVVPGRGTVVRVHVPPKPDSACPRGLGVDARDPGLVLLSLAGQDTHRGVWCARPHASANDDRQDAIDEAHGRRAFRRVLRAVDPEWLAVREIECPHLAAQGHVVDLPAGLVPRGIDLLAGGVNDRGAQGRVSISLNLGIPDRLTCLQVQTVDLPQVVLEHA
mmetsp:Transcript_128630/g.400253  ORF Transcript_128630/g.400253 Transcript_128630/m.400253 type:complete len:269 (-) Transcript_128630:824-1630(-)